MHYRSLVFICCFFILGSTLSSCVFTKKKSLSLYRSASTKSYDVIIVPGVPLEDDKWSRTMKGRVLWAVYLYRRGIAKNIMFSGSAVYTPYIEAEVMAKYGKALSVKPENIYVEPMAEHSTENIYYGYKAARSLGFNSIALATDPFQAKLLNNFAKKKIDDAIGIIPIVADTLDQFVETIDDPILNFDDLLVKDFKSIKERESFWKRFKGTGGKNINETYYQFSHQDLRVLTKSIH